MSRPLPAAVYWRRRLLLLGVLLLASWGVVQAWPGGSTAETPAPTAAPSAPSSPEPPAQETAEETVEDDDAAQVTTVSLAAGGKPCDPETIRISPQVPPDQPSGAPVRLQLGLSTSASEPCTFTPGADDLVALVSARDQAVWDSDVCRGAALLRGPVALSPGWVTVAEGRWSGRGSGPVCSKDEDWASPGAYRLRIGTFGGEPGSTRFELTAPRPAPEDEPAEEPTPEPTAEDAADS